MKRLLLTLSLAALAGCAQSQCYDQESCFIAQENQRSRGVALMGIGAMLMTPPPQSNVYIYNRRGW